jgi:hypothetical protein
MVEPNTDSKRGVRDERPSFAGRVEHAALRLPFTISTLALVVLAGWITETVAGAQLGTRAIERLGFAPADTISFDLLSALMSAFVTEGPVAFWTAVVAIAAFAGVAEWRHGSARATAAFWGTHLLVLAISAVVLGPLHLAGSAAGTVLFLARDVGPSAGYVGCLGYLVADVRGSWRWGALALGTAVLAGAFGLSLGVLSSEPARVSAALSHLLALPVGFVLGLVGPMRHLRGGAAR